MKFYSSSGGGLTQTRYIPDPKTWTDTGFTLPNIGAIIRIGGLLYAFGGRNPSDNKIYTADPAAPQTWTQVVGKTIPESLAGARLAIIGTNIYIFGGNVATNKIHRATLADPTTWTEVGTLDSRRDHTGLAIVGGSILIPCGHNGSSGIGTTAVASTSDPLTWSTVNGPNFINWETGVASVGPSEVIIYGGFQAATSCYGVSPTAGAAITAFSAVGDNIRKDPTIWHIGNSMWVIGTDNTQYVLEMPIDRPGVAIRHQVLPAVSQYNYNREWISSDGYLYLVNGDTNNLWRSGRTLVRCEKQTTGSSLALQAMTDTGIPTVVTPSCLLGFKSWLTDRTDLAY